MYVIFNKAVCVEEVSFSGTQPIKVFSMHLSFYCQKSYCIQLLEAMQKQNLSMSTVGDCKRNEPNLLLMHSLTHALK